MKYVVHFSISYIDATVEFFNSEDALYFMADLRKAKVKEVGDCDRELKLWLTMEEEDF